MKFIKLHDAKDGCFVMIKFTPDKNRPIREIKKPCHAQTFWQSF